MKNNQFIQSAILIIACLCTFAQNAICQSRPCTLTNSLVINTGYNPGTGSAISIGSTDPAWIVTALSPAQAAIPGCVTVGAAPYAVASWGSWASPGAASRYVSSVNANGYSTNTTSGRYATTIRRTFKTCINDNIKLDMYVACDDTIVSIKVDGGTSLYTNTGVWNGSPSVHISTTIPLSAGIHTIDIEGANIIDNYNNNDNYFGIDVIGSVSSVSSSNTIATTIDCACSNPCGDLKGFNICTDPIAGPFVYTFTPNVSPVSTSYVIDFGDFTSTYTGSGNTPVSHTYTGSGTFTVTISLLDGAGKVCYTKKIQLCISADGARPQPAAIKETETTEALNPYPNPANTEINIPVFSSKGEVKIFIVRQDGVKLREVTEAAPENKVIKIRTSDLVPGIYFIHITDGHGNRVRSFVQQ